MHIHITLPVYLANCINTIDDEWACLQSIDECGSESEDDGESMEVESESCSEGDSGTEDGEQLPEKSSSSQRRPRNESPDSKKVLLHAHQNQ